MNQVRLERLKDATATEWDALTQNVERLPLTQSWAYAEAMASARGWLPNYHRLTDAQEHVIGGCVTQHRHLGFSHGIRIERGPFFTTAVDQASIQASLTAIEANTRPGWLDRRRFYPAIAADTPEANAIQAAGFRPIDPGYHTLWLNLETPLTNRRQQIRQNWRHALNKAEASPIKINVDTTPENLNWLIAHHVNDMRRRRYIGPSSGLLMRLGQRTHERDEYRLIRAIYLGKPIAGGLFIHHGKAATYLVGWSGKLGRKYNAQHAILWQALETLTDMGCTSLDLGGLNPERAPGVTYFKRGLLTAQDEEQIGFATCR